METYLYFRKFRPASFVSTQGSATQTLNTITGLGGDDIDSATEIAGLVVTPADAANSDIGTNYSHPGAGADLTLATSAINSMSNSVLVFDNISQASGNGYNFEVNDKITITFQQGLETSFMYPASALMGIEATATGQTTLRFRSLKNNNQDDVVVINHDNGKYEDVVNGINAIIHGKNHEGVVTVIDGSDGKTVLSRELEGLGIDGLIYTPESGY
jgi:hypothetical protein|tara:strand:- start:8 stop:652 length:645 start_codon:yes stop_codon:yes gene_type:complete